MDALFGLATFALRAPNQLGGGIAAFEDYGARLKALSSDMALWLEARMHAQQDSPAQALAAYQQAVSGVQSVTIMEEYAAFAASHDAAAQAYDVLVQRYSSDSEACEAYVLGTLGQKAGIAAETVLGHYDAFLSSAQTHCARRFVALQAATQAKGLAKSLALPQAPYDARIARLKKERVDPCHGADVAS